MELRKEESVTVISHVSFKRKKRGQAKILFNFITTE